MLGMRRWWCHETWYLLPLSRWYVGAILWCWQLQRAPRAAHVFFIFQIKKELFFFIFQINSYQKTLWKKGTKWQSLVNSHSCFTLNLMGLNWPVNFNVRTAKSFQNLMGQICDICNIKVMFASQHFYHKAYHAFINLCVEFLMKLKMLYTCWLEWHTIKLNLVVHRPCLHWRDTLIWGVD